ncbi:MAG: ATP-binding cassette domain-containing protein [Deltaproteobacteria bacterium]|nr:ATP-binding cassette domain-containing protein [Deltaproteobacteria bacterium]
MSDLHIELKGVNKAFGNTQVLRDLNLRIPFGEITAIIGKSGEGKSVLLKHIIGLLKPDSGEVWVKGKNIWEIGRQERVELLSTFSYLFQGTALFDSMTVYENVSLPLTERTKVPLAEVKERVERVMELLDLPDIQHKYPSQLSGGMQKRVALARALVTRPETMLFDEPTTGLDPIRKVAVLNMINNYHNKLNFTGVIVSHAIPEILYICQKVAFLSEGRIVFQGTPQGILQSQEPAILEFFEGINNQCVGQVLPLWAEATSKAAALHRDL